MADAVAVLDKLHLLPPHAIPSEAAVAEWMATYRKSAPEWGMRDAAHLCGALSNIVIADCLSGILAAMPQLQSASEIATSNKEDDAHDAYFHVSRIGGCAPSVLVRMAFFARLILCNEVANAPVSIDRSLLELADQALADLSMNFLGAAPDSARYVSGWETRGASSQPISRWVHGHQIFAALSQGLIYSFQSMGRAIRAGHSEGTRRWADLSISLLRGSGAAFVLTGDFSAEEYLEVVRPSMMPPACSISLSGLMSVDHRFLVQTIRDLKPALKALHELERERHDSLQRELSTVYDRHIHVCDRLVGERPSLLTARHAKKSGPSLIEQFTTLRMKPFDSSARALRLPAEPFATAPAIPGNQAPGSCEYATTKSGQRDL
jgi:hypothetical protein